LTLGNVLCPPAFRCASGPARAVRAFVALGCGEVAASTKKRTSEFGKAFECPRRLALAIRPSIQVGVRLSGHDASLPSRCSVPLYDGTDSLAIDKDGTRPIRDQPEDSGQMEGQSVGF
jgi:hypothetical protein